MELSARMKFLAGIVGVISLCGLLFIYLNFSMSRAHSIEATLESDTYTVGIDYSGIIEKQFIDEGSYIKANDPLFEIRSSTLADAIKNNEVAKSSLLYSVNAQGKVLVSAAANGKIQTINYRQGAFVPANAEIAIVNIENALYVSSIYTLSSPDYARLNNKSKVAITFPDNKTVEGSIYDISLEKVRDEVQTTVKTRFQQEDINKVSFSPGTPVTTVLYLDNDTWYSQITSFIKSLFRPSAKL